MSLTLYTCDDADCVQRAGIFKRDLAAIGISIRIHKLDNQYGPGKVYDLRDDGWYVDEFDPNAMIGVAMLGLSNGLDPTFTDPHWLRRFQQVDRLDADHGRFDAFGRLDLTMMRKAAPWAAYAQQIDRILLSANTGCATVNPVYGIDLAALCLND
jgi:hypothetical protein